MLDYLIIGFGLGGMHLANRLEEYQKTFMVYNDQSQKASKVAGGLCNPVILNKFSVVSNGIQSMKIAVETYKSLEKKLNSQFLFDMPIHLKLESENEQLTWTQISQQKEMGEFLNPKLIAAHNYIPSEYQFGEVFNSRIVQVPQLLNSYTEYLIQNEKYISASFDYSALDIKKDHFCYKNIKTKKIIFCEGFGMKKNSFYNYLPLAGNKGEYLLIYAPQLKLKVAIKSTFFLIPMAKDCYKFGATYAREFTDQSPTETTKNRLIRALEELTDCPYSLLDHTAGIRPTTPDHQPLLGQHPLYQNMFICNGFGSRGILNAPTFSKKLMELMEEGKPIPSEINIMRFQKKWFKNTDI